MMGLDLCVVFRRLAPISSAADLDSRFRGKDVWMFAPEKCNSRRPEVARYDQATYTGAISLQPESHHVPLLGSQGFPNGMWK